MIPHIQVIATSDPITNTLIIKAPDSIQKQIETMLEILDKPNNTKTLYIQKITYIPAQDLAQIIQTVMTFKSQRINTGIAIADAKSNKIIILDEKDNLQNITNIIKKLDSKYNQKNSTVILNLKQAKPDQIANLLNQIK